MTNDTSQTNEVLLFCTMEFDQYHLTMNTISRSKPYRLQLWIAGGIFLVSILGLALTLPAHDAPDNCWIKGMIGEKSTQGSIELAFDTETTYRPIVCNLGS